MIHRINITDAELNAVQHGLRILANAVESFDQAPCAPLIPPPWEGQLMPTPAQLRDLAQRLETGVDA